ncbi:hypothetical protein B0H15DRAFT_803079 [Mycena belliarum]|uniref:DUF6589 domain-containing protein n=1 Tax=Mycena belliarum TaxID=1033014 RepID=A0AAD6U2Y6_9AGAR|nr:hypothetical protein B0H15DRAFT_803079 [Mycena belliae]
MARSRTANRYIVLSSDDPGPPIRDDDADSQLPPSDPPEPLSGSDSETELRAPIPSRRRLPALVQRNLDNSSPAPSSPLQARGSRRFFRAVDRSSSLPPHDSPRIVSQPEHQTSDDIVLTPRAERRFINKRGQVKRQETLREIRAEKDLAAATAANHERQREQERIRTRIEVFTKVLVDLKRHDLSLAEFLDHVFDPENKFDDDWRWKGFFAHKPLVERIFGYWTTSRYNQTTRNLVHEWAISQVTKTVYSEARAITVSSILSKSKKIINEQFFLNFSLSQLTKTIRGLAPTAFAIFDSFSTTARQKAQRTAAFMQKKELMKGCAALNLLRGASQNNSYAQAVMSTYLAATGGQRQHFSVLSLYGFSMSYSSTISKTFAPKTSGEEAATSNEDVSASDWEDAGEDKPPPLAGPSKGAARKKRNKKKKKASAVKTKARRVRGPGLLTSLRDACMATTRELAASHRYSLVYDNINLMNRIAEQILGRKSAQENGTCATLLALHNAKLEHLLTSDLDKAILAARPLTIDDITLDSAETEFFIANMEHTILRTITRYGGEGFAKWQGEVDASQPVSADTIDVHKTPLHPLPTMEIDESTITGNVEVIEEIVRVLGFKVDDPEYAKYVQIIAGDQLTIARQRSILNIRLGHESGPHAWKHIVLMPGLFHAKIADCHGVLTTHFGKPTVRSPGSLGFHNTVLDRLPITLTSLPPFRTTRDLIMVSLYSRVLHFLLLVSGTDSLDACAESIKSFDTLVKHAKAIYSNFANADRVQELRERRIPEERARDEEIKAATKAAKKSKAPAPDKGTPHIRKGDMVFENGVLFLRDALLTREFSDAIKAGDSGRVLLVLRLWAFSYRGNGRTKYAHEMLHLLHNLICVWTKELRYIVLQNWLANPQGKANCFVEIDLVQEHLNFWIKKIYKVDGEGHSWEWLSLISPCVDILRQLATKINTDLGARQGSKHATPDLQEDITVLMSSLAEHEVYVEKEGRVLDDDEKAVPDTLSVGMAALTHGSSTTPLDEFNHLVDTLRRRRGLTAVHDLLGLTNTTGRSASSSSTPTLSVPAAAVPPLSIPGPATPAAVDTPLDDDDEFAGLPGLQEPEDSDTEAEEEDEDLFADSPTLTRSEEGDVELDMDDVPEWYLDDADASGSDSDGEVEE